MMEGGHGFLPPASRASATSKKHRCRVCGRSFPSGRSLGGHMRSHVYSSPRSPTADCFDERQGSYSLRENPKKSRRFCADDGGTKMKCVECGREFASWKALFGHMRCHTEKGREERAERDGGSCASNGSHSDTGSRKRTSLWIGEAASASNCSSFLTSDGEAEEGAIGLMLLSRGLRHWNYAAAAAWGGEECSSDTNWEVLESSDLVPNATEKSGSELGDSRIEFKKVESDDEIEGSGFHGSEFELGRNSSAMDNGGEKRSKFECKSCNKVFDSYQALGGHRASHKRIKGCHDTEAASVDDTPLLMMEAEAEAVRPPPAAAAAKATKKHQCSICNKFFNSGQALGGHKRSHLAAAGSAPGADAASSVVIPQAQHHEMPNFFDLNDLPSEESEEVKSWWSGGDLNHEMMVGVILN